jgi:hypothetical protein
MAITKKNIDFDVYERETKESRVDWGKAAKDITTTFEKIRDDRQTRKDEIQKSVDDQQTILNEIGEYDNQTLQTTMINSGFQGGQQLTFWNNELKAGRLTPRELQERINKQKAGFTLVKKNAEAFDTTFAEWTARLGKGNGGGAMEEYNGNSLKGFASMNNIAIETDSSGNLVMYRTDPQTGEIDRNDTISIQEMTLLMKQKFDEFDLTAGLKGAQEEIGRQITKDLTILNKDNPNYKITSQDISKAQAEILGDGNALTLYAERMIAAPNDMNDFMVKNPSVTTADGQRYRIGTKKEYDDFEGTPENNPILYADMEGSGVQVPQFSEAQKKIAVDAAKELILTSMDYKEDIRVGALAQKNAAQIKADDFVSAGNNVNLAVSGDAKQAKAALRYLVDNSNGNISSIQKTSTGFVVTYPNKKPMTINTENMNVDQSNRTLWKAAGMEGDYDSWVNKGGQVGTTTTRQLITESGPQSLIEYDTNTNVKDKDGNEISAIEWAEKTTLGKTPSVLEGDTNVDMINVFTELLNKEEFYPAGLARSKITMSGDDMTLTIGTTPYSLGDVFGMKTSEIVQKLQEKIQLEVDKSNKSTSTSNAAPSDIRLKKNINKIGVSPNGHNIYSFEYIDQSKYGCGLHQGVIAQEVPDAQVEVGDYYYVDYNKLDVTFKQI